MPVANSPQLQEAQADPQEPSEQGVCVWGEAERIEKKNSP